MQKSTLLLFVLSIPLLSCKKDVTTDFATLSGKITNHLGKNGRLGVRDGYNKKIKIAADGSFSDTFHLSDQGVVMFFSDGNETTEIFMKNGYDLNLTLNTDEFDETIKYTGEGANNNNYLAQRALLKEDLLYDSDLFDLEEEDLNTNVDLAVAKLKAFLADNENLDPLLIAHEKKEIEGLKPAILTQYTEIQAQKEANIQMLHKPSPAFENYENYNGGTTSLKDLKGKFVYIDVWATWCGPCKAEIPHLKTLEEKYHGKNIEFVSISVDSEKDHDAWKKMIQDKGMGGTQLFANNSWKSDFAKAYRINSIPRFILIDPKGNVLDADMTRPSQAVTVETLDKLLK